MAKKSLIEKNEKIKKMSLLFINKRQEANEKIKSCTSIEDAIKYYSFLEKTKRFNKNRVNLRCSITGRPHAVNRKLGLCRNVAREELRRCNIPGATIYKSKKR